MTQLNRLQALALLTECTGNDIWSLDHCRLRGVPADWVEELIDCYESSFEQQRETIYVQHSATNQYEGVRDVDLAMKLGEFLGVQVDLLYPTAINRTHLVRLIREEVEEM